MNVEMQFDATRWRENTRPTPISAPTPRSPRDARNLVQQYNQVPWDKNNAQQQQPIAASAFRAYAPAQASPPHQRAGDAAENLRHTTATPRPHQNELAFVSPHQPANNSTTQGSLGSHSDQTKPRDPYAQGADGPLALQIPRSSDLPRISPATSGPSHAVPPHSSLPPSRTHSQSTLLPSIASIQQAAARNDDFDEPVIAPMSERLTCNSCTKLGPIIQDVSVAVAELDQTVQSHCQRNVTRTLDIPRDSTLRTAQWILDRLRYAKHDLHDANQRALTVPHPQSQGYQSAGFASHIRSPSSSLKRASDHVDADDASFVKRQRSGSNNDGLFRSYSPGGSDSIPGSAYPHARSPSVQGRSLRPLPSPSSLAYPHSAAQSVAGAGAQSMSSPTSYQPGSSIQTASNSAAANQHIADLQHQVTLKSLALQTLQSEYASLLQKLQRERVKGQAIEKKTNVADLEVNELTTRNEELAEQVKSLESQLEEMEKRRDVERSDATREKDQWSRMLDMSGRLQAKNAEDRQRLLEEKKSLEERVLAYERDREARFLQMKKSMGDRLGRSRTGSPASLHEIGKSSGASGEQLPEKESETSVALQQENAQLKSRLESLRSALDEVQRRAGLRREEEQKVTRQRAELDELMAQALRQDERAANSRKPDSDSQKVRSPPAPASLPANAATSPQSESAAPLIVSPRHAVTGTGSYQAALPSPETMSRIGRAASPGPEELGFDVTLSDASPDELIKALGPLPESLKKFKDAASNAKQQTANTFPLNIPAWNPPAAFNRRDAEGPGTPYPGTETSSGWAPVRQHRPKSSVARKGNKSRGASPAVSGLVDKAGTAAQVMPPPPRPGVSSEQTISWRPSE